MPNQQKIVPGWIYSLADYRQMFDLSDKDLKKKIIDYPGGVSSFNAELSARGGQVISGDDAYKLSAEDMQEFAQHWLYENQTFLQGHLDKLRNNDPEFIQAVFSGWNKSVDLFVEDFPKGVQQHRYVFMELPTLAVEDHAFDLALCSDLLFHSHVNHHHSPHALIAELCRVAAEVRVYPLLTETGEMSDALGPVMLQLQEQNFGVEVRQVEYEQLKGGNAMLRVWAKECVV